MRLRSLHRAYPSLHPSGVVHWVPEQLNIKAVTGACKLIDGCSLALCSTTVSVVSAGICHRNKVNSIAWLYRKAQPKDSIIYITLHYITIIIINDSQPTVFMEPGNPGNCDRYLAFRAMANRIGTFNIGYSINQSINQDFLNVPANKYHVGAHGNNEWN